METLRQRLKRTTSVAHRDIENSVFYEKLKSGELPKLSTLSYLHCLAILHATIERNLDCPTDPRIKKLSESYVRKVPLLLSDLSHIGVTQNPLILEPVQETLKFASEILKNSKNEILLLGYLYIFEGSQNGGSQLKTLFSDSADIETSQLTYFGCYGENTKTAWADFCNLIDSFTVTEQETLEIERAAISTFEALYGIIGRLYPYSESSLSTHITAYNVEAGNHGMPTDPRLIELALRCGLKAWAKFPYLEDRFGDRGKRFTTSDSCWLVTLITMELPLIRKSINWLRTVLASRGIPTFILESQLQEIVNEYQKVYPERLHDTVPMQSIVNELKNLRENIFSNSVKDKLIEKINDIAAIGTNQEGEHLVNLLVSAKSDELSGISNSYHSVESWFLERNKLNLSFKEKLRIISEELNFSHSQVAK